MKREARLKDEEPVRNDAQMMQDPDRWPCWPILPLKKPDGFGGWASGILIESADRPIKVYAHNMYDIPKRAEDFKVAGTYETFEAIVADGWLVD